MKNAIRRIGLAIAVFGLSLAAGRQAQADLTYSIGSSNAAGAINVAITDTVEGTITATINGAAITVLRVGELVTFTVPVGVAFGGTVLGVPVIPNLSSASRDLLEPPGSLQTGFSDRLLVAGLGGVVLPATQALLVSFASDPALTLPGGTVFPSMFETGGQQAMFFATATGGGQTAVVNFSVASETGIPVPEPSTIVMACTVVPMGLLLARRRARMAARIG